MDPPLQEMHSNSQRAPGNYSCSAFNLARNENGQLHPQQRSRNNVQRGDVDSIGTSGIPDSILETLLHDVMGWAQF